MKGDIKEKQPQRSQGRSWKEGLLTTLTLVCAALTVFHCIGFVDYDITFSAPAEAWKRRTKRDSFSDFAHLTQSDICDNENPYFFGGRDYLPLYYALTGIW